MPDGFRHAKTLSNEGTWGMVQENGQRCMADFRMARRQTEWRAGSMPRSLEDTGETIMLARRALIALLGIGGLAACQAETAPPMPGTAAGPGSAPLQQATDAVAGRNSAPTAQGQASMSNRSTTGEAVTYRGRGTGTAGRGVPTQTPGASPTYGGRGS